MIIIQAGGARATGGEASEAGTVGASNPYRSAVPLVRAIAGALGLVCVLAGAVFFLQGIDVLGGSFMSGSARWAVIGAVLVAAGVGLLGAARFRSAR